MCFVCITALWLLLLFSIVLFSSGIKRKYFNNRCGSISEIILQWTFLACASYYLERARVCWFFQSYSEVPQTPLCTTAIMNEDVEMLTEAQVSVSPTFTHILLVAMLQTTELTVQDILLFRLYLVTTVTIITWNNFKPCETQKSQLRTCIYMKSRK